MLRSNSKHYYFLRLGLLANRAIDKRSLLIQAYSYTGNQSARIDNKKFQHSFVNVTVMKILQQNILHCR